MRVLLGSGGTAARQLQAPGKFIHPLLLPVAPPLPAVPQLRLASVPQKLTREACSFLLMGAANTSKKENGPFY